LSATLPLFLALAGAGAVLAILSPVPATGAGKVVTSGVAMVSFFKLLSVRSVQAASVNVIEARPIINIFIDVCSTLS
jgi:hypothetical protein